jgi:dTDP-4-dehydrorhamnose reductase
VIVVTGALGQLGTAFRARLGEEARYIDVDEVDLTDAEATRSVIAGFDPSLVINCAAYTAVDAAEEHEPIARAVNATAVGELAALSSELGSGFVTFSTDYVFDGTKNGPYFEDDEPKPINAYGRTKLEGERLALAANPEALIIRTSALLSGTHPNFAATMLRLMAEGPVRVVDDQYGHPTFADDLAAGTLRAVDAGASGLLHLTNQGTTTWFGLAREIAEAASLEPNLVQPVGTDAFPRPAARPANSVLESGRLAELGIDPLPDYHDSLARAVAQLAGS